MTDTVIGVMATVPYWLRRPNSATTTPAVLGAMLAGALLLSACAPSVQTHGYRPDPEALARVQPGQTTREEVLQLLGSPSSSSTFDGQAWYYITQRTEQLSFYQQEVVAQNVIAIAFDGQGVVSEVRHRGLDDAHEVALVERETRTVGNELGVLEQFIGNIGRFNLPRDDRAEERDRR